MTLGLSWMGGCRQICIWSSWVCMQIGGEQPPNTCSKTRIGIWHSRGLGPLTTSSMRCTPELSRLLESTVKKPPRYCWHMIRETYRQVDKNIGKILEAVDVNETYVILISDHGMTHLDWNPFVKEHLQRAGLLKYKLDLSTDDPSNLSIDWKHTKCHPLEPCHAHIFINLKGRDPQGIVEPEDYEKVQEEIINCLDGDEEPGEW